MNPAHLLHAARDPLGSPLPASIFQYLLVATFSLHIFFITLAVGASFTVLLAFWNRNSSEHFRSFARVCARIVPNSIGFGVVTGIAPLLFVQTIYDSAWYTANALEGFWSILFIFIVSAAYSLSYLFYLRGAKDGKLVWSSAISLLLICAAGAVMHLLSTVSIQPQNWLAWYRPHGIVDTSGTAIHAFVPARYAFLLFGQATISLAVVMLLFGWYFGRRTDADRGFVEWVADHGRHLGLIATPIYALLGLAWAATQGIAVHLAIPMAIAVLLISVMLLAIFMSKQPIQRLAFQALGAWFVALLGIGVVRETIRAQVLGGFGDSVATYPYHLDWGAISFFLVTTVLGVTVLLYLIRVMYESGTSANEVEISAGTDRIGRLSINLFIVWFLLFIITAVTVAVHGAMQSAGP